MAKAVCHPVSSKIPEIVRKYQSSGNPLMVIIDLTRTVILSDFHIKADQTIALIELLTANTNFIRRREECLTGANFFREPVQGH
jgi:hypothetical protein